MVYFDLISNLLIDIANLGKPITQVTMTNVTITVECAMMRRVIHLGQSIFHESSRVI